MFCQFKSLLIVVRLLFLIGSDELPRLSVHSVSTVALFTSFQICSLLWRIQDSLPVSALLLESLSIDCTSISVHLFCILKMVWHLLKVNSPRPQFTSQVCNLQTCDLRKSSHCLSLLFIFTLKGLRSSTERYLYNPHCMLSSLRTIFKLKKKCIQILQ